MRTLHWSDGVFPAPRAMPARPVRHVRLPNPAVVSSHSRHGHPPALALAMALGMTVAEVACKHTPAAPGALRGRHQPQAAGLT